MVSVVCLVGEQATERASGVSQSLGDADILDASGPEQKPARTAPIVNEVVQLDRPYAARAAYGLEDGPFPRPSSGVPRRERRRRAALQVASCELQKELPSTNRRPCRRL